jgi:hypothetical protein
MSRPAYLLFAAWPLPRRARREAPLRQLFSYALGFRAELLSRDNR